MGLLEQILGAAVRKRGTAGGLDPSDLGDLLGGRSAASTSRGGASVLLKLLPLIVMLLRNRSAGRGARGLGGLAGLGALGGLGGLLAQLNAAGLGRQADSWVQSGANLAVSADEISSALGPDAIGQLAAEAGVSEAEASEGVAQLLPELVDQLTPDGGLPPESQVDTALDDLTRSLGI